MLDEDNSTALTFSAGYAGSEVAISGSFGFEFGGSRKMDLPQPTATPKPTGIILTEDEYETLLMAQVQQEEIEELEEKYSNTQEELDSLREQLKSEQNSHKDDDQELELLKQQVAEAIEEAEERRARVRANHAEREKGDE
jgi:peptidoglycan hydrolase CwlO-like protein